MEFGTGKRFKANGRGNIAAQFQGKAERGNFEEMVKNIAAWLKRKGYYPAGLKRNAQMGYAKHVAGNILKNGVKPANNGTGFFFRAYDELLPTILNNIRKSLKA